jgi:RNA polymerase sigma factor (sigma-70 family)
MRVLRDRRLVEFEDLYRRRFNRFLRVAIAISGDREAAFEAVQEGFAHAIRNRRSYRAEGPLEAWVWRAVVNSARKQRRSPSSHPLEEAFVPAPNGGEPTTGSELGSLIALLPERQRLVLFLRYYADLDYRSIANALGRLQPSLVFALAAALAILVAAPAFGLGRGIIDFFASEPAPERVQVDYARMRARAVLDFGPKIVPLGEAREVMTASADGTRRPFWVVPIQGGGFCFRWHTFGSCGRVPRLGNSEARLGVGWQEGKFGAAFVVGDVLAPEIETVQLRYEDGASTDLSVVWVSPPIDAGFFAFEVPDEHQRAGHGAEALVALDGDGKVVERSVLPHSDPRWEQGPDGLPRIADRTQKRTLFDFRDENGKRWTLTVAPAPGDRLCFSYDRGGGCHSPEFPNPSPLGVWGGGATVVVCCTVGDGVARVTLKFEDGDSIELVPREGFLLHAVPFAHYPRGHRLEAIVQRDASGREVGRTEVPTGRPAVYPCGEDQEIDLGYGQSVCP